jgi:hypothetical protein
VGGPIQRRKSHPVSAARTIDTDADNISCPVTQGKSFL